MLALLLLLLIAPRSAAQAPDSQAVMPPGQIIEKVACVSDPDQTYALYLPSNYVRTRKWPILYAFDPGARGSIPVERFKEAAEEFGWIVAGSNNSRNGNMQASIAAWNAITRDTSARFSLDDQRAYAAGFSGGARVAILFASQCNNCLAGVIASGAGFPAGLEPATTMRFALFAVAGTEDFNFPEVKSLDETLTRVKLTHQIEIFSGHHDWPPATVALDAVAWMELMAMRSGRREGDAKFIDDLWQSKQKQARELETSGKTYEAFQIYLQLSSSFKDIRDVGELESKVNQLRTSREVRDAIRDEQQEIRKQRETEGQIASLVAATDRIKIQNADAGDSSANSRTNDQSTDTETRLQALLAELNRQSKSEQDSVNRRVARRILEGQYVGFVEKGFGLLQAQRRYDDVIRVFTLASQVAPERPGPFYYLAWAYNAKGDKKKSLKALQAAVEKGFSDLNGLETNKAFESLRGDPQYQQIIDTLKRKR